MDPLTHMRIGQIRQEEFIKQAEEWRYSDPIWERLWRRVAPILAARRKRYASDSLDTRVTTAPASMVDNC
jgi:hypothetical protein